MAKATKGYGRTRRFTVRLTEDEAKQLVEIAKSTGAKTVAAQLRKFALAPRQFRMPPWEAFRDLRNAVINANNARDLPALEKALERISRF